MNFLTGSNKVKAAEVLYFEDAEIEKYKGSYEAFGATGPLSVLYFKDYNRFVLQINDWKYPLLQRLPIILTSDKNSTSHRTYTFPASNGFTFQLKINNITSHQALINFETILGHNSLFSIKGEDTTNRKREMSPEDKLIRHPTKEVSSTKDIISSNIKSAVDKVFVKAATYKYGTKNLTSTKKRIVLKDIKTKNFKKNAKTSFKKDFFRNGDIATYELFSKRRSNINMSEAKELKDLMKSSGPIVEIYKADIEESILKNKDLAIAGKFAPIEKEAKKSMFQSVKQGITGGISGGISGISGGISGMASKIGLKKDEISGARDTAQTLKQEKFTTLESTHHSEA